MPLSSDVVAFEIMSSTGDYRVEIAPGLLAKTLAEGGERVFVVDARFAATVRAAGFNPIVIKSDESVKSLDRMADIVIALRERRATRETELVAIGGGVVQDVAAFVASVYMRGLRWLLLPTTLLSMADSCIGGKSSINVGKYKNLVGSIHSPERVLIDPELVHTLSDEQRAAGLCEAAKICFCRGPGSFAGYLAIAPNAKSDAETLTCVIEQSLRAKKWFIEMDEFDRAERLALNFGHSFGHAIEAGSDFAIGHGIAVGLGMLAALHLGELMGVDYADVPEVEALRSQLCMLLSNIDDLPRLVSNMSVDGLLDAFQSDKKHLRDAYAVITVDEQGMVRRKLLARDGSSTALIADAFAMMRAEVASARLAA